VSQVVEAEAVENGTLFCHGTSSTVHWCLVPRRLKQRVCLHSLL